MTFHHRWARDGIPQAEESWPRFLIRTAVGYPTTNVFWRAEQFICVGLRSRVRRQDLTQIRGLLLQPTTCRKHQNEKQGNGPLGLHAANLSSSTFVPQLQRHRPLPTALRVPEPSY